MNKRLDFETFKERTSLVNYVNEHQIKQEDVQQITDDPDSVYRFTLWYWH